MRDMVHLLAPSAGIASRWALDQGWHHNTLWWWDVLVPGERGLQRLQGCDRPVVIDLYDVCTRRGGVAESAELQEIYARVRSSAGVLISGADEQVQMRVAMALHHRERHREVGELRLNLQVQWIGMPEQYLAERFGTEWRARWTAEPVPGVPDRMSLHSEGSLTERIDAEIEDWERSPDAMRWSPEPEETESGVEESDNISTETSSHLRSSSAVLTWLPGGDSDGDEVVFQGYLADGVFYQT